MKLYGDNYKLYLILPAILFIVFFFLIFVSPTVPEGIDLKGGTMYIIRLDSAIDTDDLTQHLQNNFPITDLLISSIISPGGEFGLTIQYAENTVISAAEAELNTAKSLLESSPNEAKQHALAAISLVVDADYITQPAAQNLAPEQAVTVANDSIATAKNNFEDLMLNAMKSKFNIGENFKYQKREIGPTLGASFWESAQTVAIVAFIFITIVIFIFFRQIVPSAAVILAAAFDVFGALALMALFNVPLSLSSIPALLMLVGYSVDTDIMLTTRLIKRTGHLARERTIEAMKTGLTMTFTTLAALASMLVLSYFGQIIVVFEIAAVLLFGLVADIVSTWFMNAPMLLWYVNWKSKGKGIV